MTAFNSGNDDPINLSEEHEESQNHIKLHTNKVPQDHISQSEIYITKENGSSVTKKVN